MKSKRYLQIVLLVLIVAMLPIAQAGAAGMPTVSVTVEPIYDKLGDFVGQNGYVPVQQGKKWGFINKNGETIVPCEYTDVAGFIDTLGYTYDSWSNGGYTGELLGAVKKGGKWAFVNESGEIITPFEYDKIWDFSEGVAVVVKNSKVGYMGVNGELALPLGYKSGNDFSSGLASVQDKNGWHYIDHEGNIVLEFEYYMMYVFWEDLAVTQVKAKGKYGYSDTLGRLVIPAVYDEADRFWGGHAQVRKDGKWGVIDKEGNVIVPIEYDSLNGYFYHGLLSVCKDGKWGFVNEVGEVAIPLDSDAQAMFISGLARVKQDDKYGAIDPEGNLVVSAVYEGVSSSSVPNLLRAKQDGKWGIIDAEGNVVLPFEYDDITYLYSLPNDGIFGLLKDGKWGIAIVNPGE